MAFEYIEDEAIRTQAQTEHDGIVGTINAGIEDRIATETSGLKENRDTLLGEVKEAKKATKDWQALGELEKVRESLQWLKDNEDAQLIKDGKIDEVVFRRTQEMREGHEEVVLEYQTKLTASETMGSGYKTMYETKMVEDDLTKEALKAGVLPGAIQDVLLHGTNIFQLGENNEVEARDGEGKLLKTKEGDQIVTTTNWIQGLKVSSPHYWPASEGGGHDGGDGRGGSDDLQIRIDAAAKSGNQPLYNELRAKQMKKK